MKLHLPYKLLIISVVYSLVVSYFIFGKGIYNISIIIIALIFVFSGIVIGFWVKEIIRNHKTTLNPYGKPTTLITSGPFKFSRNPMYASYLLVALGFAIYSGTWIGFIGPVLYFLYLNFRIIPTEEQKLKEAFSTDYEIYFKKVRRWL